MKRMNDPNLRPLQIKSLSYTPNTRTITAVATLKNLPDVTLYKPTIVMKIVSKSDPKKSIELCCIAGIQNYNVGGFITFSQFMSKEASDDDYFSFENFYCDLYKTWTDDNPGTAFNEMSIVAQYEEGFEPTSGNINDLSIDAFYKE